MSGPSAQCFQGFCINTGQSLLARWWEFSVTYMELVAPGMIFAFLVAGLTAAFLFPQGVRLSSSGGIWGSIKGLAVGTPLSLCSACIVPITRALRGSGASISTTLGVIQGSATLNIPALLMVALIFTPLLGGSRILLSLLAGLLIGPLVARVVGGESDEPPPSGVPLALGDAEPVGWGEALWEATRDWARASLGYLLRLGPIMVIAGLCQRAGVAVGAAGRGGGLPRQRPAGRGAGGDVGNPYQRAVAVRDPAGGGAAVAGDGIRRRRRRCCSRRRREGQSPSGDWRERCPGGPSSPSRGPRGWWGCWEE